MENVMQILNVVNSILIGIGTILGAVSVTKWGKTKHIEAIMQQEQRLQEFVEQVVRMIEQLRKVNPELTPECAKEMAMQTIINSKPSDLPPISNEVIDRLIETAVNKMK